MLLEGVKLMILGMSIVFLFLTLQILLMMLVARLTQGIAAKELEQIKADKAVRAQKAKISKQSVGAPVAILTAAVKTYEDDI